MYKNYKNPLKNAKVIVEKSGTFFSGKIYDNKIVINYQYCLGTRNMDYVGNKY